MSERLGYFSCRGSVYLSSVKRLSRARSIDDGQYSGCHRSQLKIFHIFMSSLLSLVPELGIFVLVIFPCHLFLQNSTSIKEDQRPDRSDAASHVGAAILAHLARSG